MFDGMLCCRLHIGNLPATDDVTENVLKEFLNKAMQTSGLAAGDCVIDVYINKPGR